MTTLDATDGLPAIQARWVRELLEAPIPPESLATCDSCAMLPEQGETPGAEHFRPDTKCCTFTPDLANFLVGALLTDDDPALARGRETVRERLQAKVGVTPLGVDVAADRSLLYLRSGTLGFGRNRALRCPHYQEEQGNCSIWRYRNGVCATWHCKYVRGAKGLQFWDELKNLLIRTEQAVAEWCLLEADLPAEALRSIFAGLRSGEPASLSASDLDHSPPATYDALWDGWRGREEEWFQSCAERVSGLSFADIGSIAGQEVRARARMVRDAFDQLRSTELPKRLRTGNYSVLHTDSGTDAVLLITFSTTQPLRASRRLLDVLPMFNGVRVDAALQRIEAERGLKIAPGLLQRLVDNDVLVSADRPLPLPIINC